MTPIRVSARPALPIMYRQLGWIDFECSDTAHVFHHVEYLYSSPACSCAVFPGTEEHGDGQAKHCPGLPAWAPISGRNRRPC